MSVWRRFTCGVAGCLSARAIMRRSTPPHDHQLDVRYLQSGALDAADGRTKYEAFGMHHGMAQSVAESGP